MEKDTKEGVMGNKQSGVYTFVPSTTLRSDGMHECPVSSLMACDVVLAI